MPEYNIFDAGLLHLTQNLDLQLQCYLVMPQYLHHTKANTLGQNYFPSTTLQNFVFMQSK